MFHLNKGIFELIPDEIYLIFHLSNFLRSWELFNLGDYLAFKCVLVGPNLVIHSIQSLPKLNGCIFVKYVSWNKVESN